MFNGAFCGEDEIIQARESVKDLGNLVSFSRCVGGQYVVMIYCSGVEEVKSRIIHSV